MIGSMRLWTSSWALILVLISADASADASLADPAIQSAAIDAMFAEASSPGSPGAAVGVYGGGRILFAKGYGLADLESGAPITTRTPFHVASVSKQFAAFAVALLAHEGRLDIDADVRRYLPDMPDFGHPITTRQLIHHTSGLRDQWTLFRMGGRDLRDLLKHRQVVAMAQRQRTLNFSPGTDFLYSNTGYTLLAEIVKAVTGKTLREFTTEKMFAPLGMHATFFYDDVRELVPGRAHSYERREDGVWMRSLLNYDTVGASSLHSTIEDLARWAGNFGQPRVGDAQVLEEVMRSGRLADGRQVNYGFGLFTLSHDGRRAVGHSGGDASFQSYFAYYPGHDVAIAVLANRDVRVLEKVKAIADLYLPRVKGDTHGPPEAARPPSSAALDRLAGTYVNPHRAALILQRDAAGLAIREGVDPRGVPVAFYADGSFDAGERKKQHLRAPGTFDIEEWTHEYLQPVVARGGEVLALQSVPVTGLPATLYTRVVPRSPPATELAQYAGRYYSAELDVTYTVTLRDGGLVASQLWLPEPVPLAQVAGDHFDSAGPAFQAITFDRDARGGVSGARLHARHAYDVRLERQR